MALSKTKMISKYKELLTGKTGSSDFDDTALECLFQTIIESIKEDLESVSSSFPGSELIATAPGAPVVGTITTGKIKPGGFR